MHHIWGSHCMHRWSLIGMVMICLLHYWHWIIMGLLRWWTATNVLFGLGRQLQSSWVVTAARNMRRWAIRSWWCRLLMSMTEMGWVSRSVRGSVWVSSYSSLESLWAIRDAFVHLNITLWRLSDLVLGSSAYEYGFTTVHCRFYFLFSDCGRRSGKALLVWRKFLHRWHSGWESHGFNDCLVRTECEQDLFGGRIGDLK